MQQYDTHRALRKTLLVAMLIYFLLYVFVAYDSVFDPEVNGMALFMYIKGVSYISWLIPLIAALPFGAGLIVDLKSEFTRISILRTGRRRYIRSKLLVGALSGGIALAGGIVLYLLLLLVTGHPMAAPSTLVSHDYMLEVMRWEKTGTLYFLGIIYLQFLSGAFWSLSALAFSAYVSDPFLVICFPMFLQRLLQMLVAHFNLPQWMNLGQLGRGTTSLGFTPLLLIATLVFGFLIYCAIRLFICGFERRLGNA